MVEEEHHEHEIDPALVRTGRLDVYKKKQEIIIVYFQIH